MSSERAQEHFAKIGRKQKRSANAQEHIEKLERLIGPTPDDFDEAAYLKHNNDVRVQFNFPGGGRLHYLMYGRNENRNYKAETLRKFNEHTLNLLTNRIYDMPDVVVDETAPRRINVLVPAFEFKSMSAGFFGVFQVGRFIKACGYSVRIVLFDNFYWNYDEFKEKLAGYPGMERLYEEVEIEYIGERRGPLIVSPNDRCVATVWYSAHFAKKISDAVGGKRFLYLIQDYETNFFAGSALYALADETYTFNYAALFSTEFLKCSFERLGIGNFASALPPCISFNNACAASMPERGEFLSRSANRTRRLAFYSRPDVNRNMFELGALALCTAIRAGVFDSSWEFIGVGMGNVEIDLGSGRLLRQMPRMNLKDYMAAIRSFDVGLTLMASPHPSLLPFDLAGSGSIVLTNEFGVKKHADLAKISHNILAVTPKVPDLVAGLRIASKLSDDLKYRYDGAVGMDYPRRWEDSFNEEHVQFIKRWADGAL